MAHPADRYADPVLRRQVELLYERKRRVILVFPVLGGLFLLLLRGPGVSASSGWIWLAILCVTTLAGAWLHEAWHRRTPGPGDLARWTRLGIANSGLNGLAFGLAGLLLFPPDPERRAYLLVLIAGITSTAIASSGSVLSSYLLFLVCAVAPVVVRFAAAPEEAAHLLAAITALYGAVMAALAFMANRTITGAIRLELENRGLVEELSVANRDLEARVTERTAELERTEERFRQAQKLEAVGRLAGGVAHDYNNTLTVILGHCELLGASKDLPGDVRVRVETIRAAATRAADLTRHLLAFSRRQMLRPRPVAAGRILEELGSMLHRLIREEIELVIRDDSTRPIHADPVQLSHALMNLVINAVDAIEHGGRIDVTARDRFVGPEEARDHADIPAGPGVELVVADSGQGMDEATQVRIFEPFFTTKDQGKGTGLGLSTVWGIVVQSGGFVTVTSAPGRGSTFRVWLPAATAGEV